MTKKSEVTTRRLFFETCQAGGYIGLDVRKVQTPVKKSLEVVSSIHKSVSDDLITAYEGAVDAQQGLVPVPYNKPALQRGGPDV